MINGEHPPKTRQILDCGAAVRLDDAVAEHGVIFIHPELPPMRLVFQIDPTFKTLPKYHMEPIQPEHGAATQFAIHVHECAEPILDIPPAKKLIKPGEH
jgi:hypothetical protein